MNANPRRILVAAIAVVVGVGLLVGCAPTTTHPVIAPISRTAGSLQGKTIKLPLDAILNIDTGSLGTSSYSAVVSDPSVARFTAGYTEDGGEYNPGIKPLKVGETKVVLKNKNGGIQWVTFTVDVVSS